MKEKTSTLPAKLLMLYQVLSTLRAGRWTIKQLSKRFDCSLSTVYRYIDLLEEAGHCVESDFHKRYFVLVTENDPMPAQFTVEEIMLLRSVFKNNVHHPLKSSVLKKLSLNSELDAMPQLFLKAHLGNLVEQLAHAMRNQHQIILKNYHSANSDDVRDRLVEPIQFGTNYGTLIALEVEGKVCKQFKLDRIGEVVETYKTFQHKELHEAPTCDIFGLTGKTQTTVTLTLSSRAYLLLREEFPTAVHHLKQEGDTYTFIGPVNSFAGIGRFVMGLLDEIRVVSPEEFRKYLKKKIKLL